MVLISLTGNDTLKPGSWCQSGEEDGANPDMGPVNGPQHKSPLLLPRPLLQEFLEIISQIRCLNLFNSPETFLCKIVLRALFGKAHQAVDRTDIEVFSCLPSDLGNL